MSIPDPVTTGLITAAALQAAKQAQDFIAAIAGHPGESIGTILGGIGKRRSDNVETVTSKARLTLLNIGVKVQPVALPALCQALEGASMQEDPYLQDTWANLLANAADPRELTRVEQSFPGMLKELSSREVCFLDALFKELNGVAGLVFDDWSLVQVYGKAGLTDPTYVMPSQFRFQGTKQFAFPQGFRLMLDILIRQRIIAPKDEFEALEPSSFRDSSALDLDSVEIPRREVHAFTELGISFVRACQPPPLNANL